MITLSNFNAKILVERINRQCIKGEPKLLSIVDLIDKELQSQDKFVERFGERRDKTTNGRRTGFQRRTTSERRTSE